MKFLALVLALALEQAWPLRRGNRLYAGFEHYADYLERQFNGLQASHGAIAWCVAVLPFALATVIVYALLRHANVLLALGWSVAVLYVAMGFRRFSHCFTDIAQALREQNINTARDVLGRWRGAPADELHAADIARVSIELGLLQAHRYVLGPIFWFVMLGPVGPVIYRAADLLAERWGRQVEPEKRAFALFAERAFFWIDWLPARITAASFAIAGNFEDAAYSLAHTGGGLGPRRRRHCAGERRRRAGREAWRRVTRRGHAQPAARPRHGRGRRRRGFARRGRPDLARAGAVAVPAAHRRAGTGGRLKSRPGASRAFCADAPCSASAEIPLELLLMPQYVLRQRAVRGQTPRIDMSRLVRGRNRAARFFQVPAVAEPALPEPGPELDECRRQTRHAEMMHAEGSARPACR